MQKNKIEIARDGAGKTMYVPLSVFRNGRSLTISYPGSIEDRFKFATTPNGLQQFADKLEELATKYIGA